MQNGGTKVIHFSLVFTVKCNENNCSWESVKIQKHFKPQTGKMIVVAKTIGS